MRIGINALSITPDSTGGGTTYILELIKHLPEIRYYNVTTPEDIDLATVAASLAGNAAVEVCEPVYIERAFDTAIIPNDGYFIDQWGLFHINAPQAWVIEPGYVEPPAPGDVTVNDVLIAVLDTGVDYRHEDWQRLHGPELR